MSENANIDTSVQNVQMNAAPMMANLFFVKDLSVESPAAPAIFTQELGTPKINFDFGVAVSILNDGVYEVELKISASAFGSHEEQEQEDTCLYVVELTYGGIFSLNPDLESQEDKKEETLYGLCPAALFPHAARITMDAIRDAGYAPPMLLTTIDFVQAYKNKKLEGAVQAA